jgi:predicted PurR-regulated permease PerM
MQKNQNNVTLLILLFVLVVLANSIHSVITPFVLAATLAYFVSPLISFLENKLKIPRLVAIVTVFIFIILFLSLTVTNITMRIAEEQKEMSIQYSSVNRFFIKQRTILPEWAKPFFESENLNNVFGTLFTPQRLWPYFSGALSGIGSIFVFLVATFYFMKDGKQFFIYFMNLIFGNIHAKTDHMVQDISNVLNSYLRGQLLLVILMTSVSLIVLTIFQVKYALLIAIFTGLAEIVPLIGPVVATAAAAIASYYSPQIYGLSPFVESLIIISLYFILRQLEDQIVIPMVMGRATKLHPLLILFLVLIGGHIWGVVGMILAVPLAAVARIIILHAQS